MKKSKWGVIRTKSSFPDEVNKFMRTINGHWDLADLGYIGDDNCAEFATKTIASYVAEQLDIRCSLKETYSYLVKKK